MSNQSKKITPSQLKSITDRALDRVRLWEIRYTPNDEPFYALARNKQAIIGSCEGCHQNIDPHYWIFKDLGIPRKYIRHNSLTILV